MAIVDILLEVLYHPAVEVALHFRDSVPVFEPGRGVVLHIGGDGEHLVARALTESADGVGREKTDDAICVYGMKRHSRSPT